jgi:hypothetical protein
MLRRQQQFYSVGRFMLAYANGGVVDKCSVTPLFMRN